MIDISPQISEASLQGTRGSYAAQGSPPEEDRFEGKGLAQKGESKNALGVFAKLLTGLLRKSQNIPGEKPEPEQIKVPELFNRNQPKEGGGKVRAGETLFAKSLSGTAFKKQGKEEPAAPTSGQKPGKTGKKTGQTGTDIENLVPVQAGLQGKTAVEAEISEKTVAEGLTGAGNTAGSPTRKAEEPETAGFFGKKTAKKDEVSLSTDNRRPSPVFEAVKPEKPAENRPAEHSPKNKRKERLPVEVRDLRTGLQTETSGAAAAAGNAAERELVVELRPAGERLFTGNPAGNVAETEHALSAESGGNFEAMLAGRLSGELSSDIVKQAAIVLRDGGEGTIRLSLKPETLGKVKIHLEMAENKVSGHIFVESEEALRAFEREIHTLEQAFKDSGFAEASLDTALGSGDGRRRESGEDQPFFSSRLAAASYDTGSEFAAASSGVYVSGGFSAVNMLV
jgi:flagellar hook-length control protein FliK